MINRRNFCATMLATPVILSPTLSCAATCNAKPAPIVPLANAKFSRWVAAFEKRAARRGIKRATLQAGFKGGGYLPGVVSRDRNQFQKRRTLEDYIAISTSEARLKSGKAAWRKHKKLFAALESRYGVDPYVVAAIWGVETRFGERKGDVPVVSATATLAFDGRRGPFYEKQLIAALKILQRGDVSADKMLGSWAGAMGHTQFIPTSYQSFAVDFNKDGRRDVWSDNPADALASTAAYLAKSGWRKGLAWGGEAGVTRAKGDVIRPQKGGPKFVTTRNFRAILRYNNSKSYAISVGVLADRLRGLGPLEGSFPADKYGMSKAHRVGLQKALSRRYDLGDVDGVIGPQTRCAIQAFQKRKRIALTGEPSIELLKLLGVI